MGGQILDAGRSMISGELAELPQDRDATEDVNRPGFAGDSIP
jgi:hypothetical protein